MWLLRTSPIVSWQGRGTFVLDQPERQATGEESDYDAIIKHLESLESTFKRMDKRVTDLEAEVKELRKQQ